jgi:hypothetical protein
VHLDRPRACAGQLARLLDGERAFHFLPLRFGSVSRMALTACEINRLTGVPSSSDFPFRYPRRSAGRLTLVFAYSVCIVILIITGHTA